MNINVPPAVVLELSQLVGKTPMEWKEYEDRVVIVFTNGQKMIFERGPVIAPIATSKSNAAQVKKNQAAIRSNAGKKK